MLFKNWTKVLTLLTALWNDTATYIIWIVWDNYWLSQKSVARILYTLPLSANLFSLLWLKNVLLMKTCNAKKKCVNLPKIIAVFICISYRPVPNTIWPVFSEFLIFCWNNSKLWETREILAILCEINVR